MLRPPAFSDGQKIGLFGGSFNPAHEGHLAVALYALKRLGLDWIWWIVSPQNPLKDSSITDHYERRFAIAEQIAKHPRLIVTDIERQAGTQTTADFLRRLSPILSHGRFVWIMGADSFAGLHHWNDWTDIPEALPLAVLARPGYSMRALESPAALKYGSYRLRPGNERSLPDRRPPAWVFVPMPLRPERPTAIREARHQPVAR